jgi:hypothetical protein
MNNLFIVDEVTITIVKITNKTVLPKYIVLWRLIEINYPPFKI